MADLDADIVEPVRETGFPAARRRLPPAERERQIVDGAIRYFAEVGFDVGKVRCEFRPLSFRPVGGCDCRCHSGFQAIQKLLSIQFIPSYCGNSKGLWQKSRSA